MATHEHRGNLYRYEFWPIRVPTPAWLDDNDWSIFERHPLTGHAAFWVWSRLRAKSLIRRRYVGPA